MKRFVSSLSLAFSLFALPSLAHALTISAEPGVDCFSADPNKCIGGEYTLNVAADGDAYIATFTMDLSGTNDLEISATTIEQIEFKVAGEYDALSIDLAPDATGNWALADGSLGGSGCKGTNDSFVCLDAVSPLAVSDTTYTWQIKFDADSLLDESSWHIGARFASPDHEKGWILSASSAPIPEPRSYLMFGFGALIVGFAVRKYAL